MQRAREGRLLLHKSLGMTALASRYERLPSKINVQKTGRYGASHGIHLDQVFDSSGFRP